MVQRDHASPYYLGFSNFPGKHFTYQVRINSNEVEDKFIPKQNET